jgi:hypothetical protein
MQWQTLADKGIWEFIKKNPRFSIKLTIDHYVGFYELFIPWLLPMQRFSALKVVCNEKRERSGSKLLLEHSF